MNLEKKCATALHGYLKKIESHTRQIFKLRWSFQSSNWCYSPNWGKLNIWEFQLSLDNSTQMIKMVKVVKVHLHGMNVPQISCSVKLFVQWNSFTQNRSMNLHLLPKFLSRSCNVYVQSITGVFGLNTCCVGNHGVVACFPELLSFFKKISIQTVQS